MQKRLTKDISSPDNRANWPTKTWKAGEGATRLVGGELGIGRRGRRRVKVSAAGPPSPPLISSISYNHCDRRRAGEGESEQGGQNGGPMEEARRRRERWQGRATVKMSQRKGGWSKGELESASDKRFARLKKNS